MPGGYQDRTSTPEEETVSDVSGINIDIRIEQPFIKLVQMNGGV
jgi:hypothetical protein